VCIPEVEWETSFAYMNDKLVPKCVFRRWKKNVRCNYTHRSRSGAKRGAHRAELRAAPRAAPVASRIAEPSVVLETVLVGHSRDTLRLSFFLFFA
jgi:hypothetical protein